MSLDKVAEQNPLPIDDAHKGPIFDEQRSILSERIMIIDGAMGTALQAFRLTEEDFRGSFFFFFFFFFVCC